MLEERRLYIALGVAIILLGSTLLRGRTLEVLDGIVCMAAGAFVVVNGLRSLRKEKPPPHSGLRTALLLVLTSLALALAAVNMLRG